MKNLNSKKNIESRIAQITALAYRVSQQGKHDVFARYSGHVNLLEVQIYLGKWKSGLSGNHEWSLWLSTDRNRFKTLSQIRAKLNSLLKENSR